VQIVEWPGGEPPNQNLKIYLSKAAYDKLCRGANSIPLERPVSLAEMAALPWFSRAEIYEKGSEEEPPFIVLTGPARYKKGEWYLPLYKDVDEEMSDEQIRQEVQEIRKRGRFVMRQSQL
jgi:hypothetical protein